MTYNLTNQIPKLTVQGNSMRKDYHLYPSLKRKLGGHKIKDDRNMYKQLLQDGS
jgi:hypothetical protein